MYKEDLALNDLQWLIGYKTQPNHKIKWEFFKVVALSKLFYGCTTLTLMKCIDKKKLYKNYTRILCFKQILEAAPLHKTIAYLPSCKPSKYDSQDMLSTKYKLLSNVLL